MQSPASTRAAKEFLVQCIVDEAQREGIPLTEIERKMLYFSETHWTLPDIYEINAAFEQEYNTADYERKISRLIRSFKARVRRDDPAKLEDWNREVAAIASEDHYLLVIIGEAGEPSRPKRLLQLVLIGIVAGIAALLLTFAILFIAGR
ncbi:MAG TPA: hypothetical protein VN734_00965 [Acidobacteriaceae bacterium]|nr:hypothetical protein [Acidobacteriaceae bacterium]